MPYRGSQKPFYTRPLSRPKCVAVLPRHKNKHRWLDKMRQRSLIQMKEQDKNYRELNETDISNMPDKGFEVMVIKILIRLETRVDELSKDFSKETENMKRNQS